MERTFASLPLVGEGKDIQTGEYGARWQPSVGSKGDSYDNALAESVIGLYKTEVIRRGGPWRGLEDVEFATLEWVWWFNHHRLLEPIGYIPPVEHEEAFYNRRENQNLEPVLN